MSLHARTVRLAAPSLLVLLVGCARLPTAGPSTSTTEEASTPVGSAPIQVVEANDSVARQLLANRAQKLFSETLGSGAVLYSGVGPGDVLEVNIWEAPPATLFSSGLTELRAGTAAARPTTLPDQVVDRDGNIVVPFVGKVAAAGRSLSDIEADIVARLKGKANQPQVIVRQSLNRSGAVTVVGEVANSVRLPLTPHGERLLDALTAAGGVRQPVNKTTLQVTRGSQYVALPLDTVIRDPRQNVPLRPGDVVTAIYQPLSFTALGATGKNEEISFEAQGITLAQALARAGGTIDSRSDAKGVFIFRLEPKEALHSWPRQPVGTTPEGRVPVVYRLNLSDPASFFVMQSFPMSDKDLLFVSNAPAADLQKFLNLVFSVVYPTLNLIQITK